MRFFFGEHSHDLSFGRAMNACVGPTLFPMIQIGLRFFQALEAHAFQRRFLGVPDTRFNFSFSIGILDPARQCHHTVMSEHVPIQRIEGGIVDIRNQHSFPQIVENDHSDRATDATKSFLMQLGPDARTRTPHQQAYGFATVAKGHHE